MKNNLCLLVFILCFCFFQTSCKKSDVVVTSTQSIPTSPTIIATLSAPAWYGKDAGISFTAVNQISGLAIVANGVPQAGLSGTYQVTNIISPISVLFKLIRTSDMSEVSTTVVVAGCYSQDTTRLAYVPSGTQGIWRPTLLRIHDAGSPNWITGIPSCKPFHFRLDGKLEIYNTECNPNIGTGYSDWTKNGSTMTWGGNTYTVSFPDDVTMVTTTINYIGQTVEETFHKY